MKNTLSTVLILVTLLMTGTLAHSAALEPVSPPDELAALRLQLAAQQAINHALQERINALETALEEHASGASEQKSLDATAPAPTDLVATDTNTAVAQSLITKQLLIQAPGTIRLTPTANWSHSGAQSEHYNYSRFAVGVGLGLPAGLTATAVIPYTLADTYYGSNSGFDDLSLALQKQFLAETTRLPTIVGSLNFTNNTSNKAFQDPSIGGAFKYYDLTLSAFKTLSPVVIYGNLFYSRAVKRYFALYYESPFNGTIQPGDTKGISLGVSLAATPAISINTGLTFDFGRGTRYARDGLPEYTGAGFTDGRLSLGAGFLLTKHWFLGITAEAGVTKDASDFIFSIALPYRF
jgi:type II secretory pathway pseudopilin PulG